MIEFINVTYSIFENGVSKIILDDFSYKFKENCTTVITGHNGSGKSTLLKLIIGIIKPTSGKILYKGKDITNLEIYKRVKLGLNYAFQQPVTFKGVTVKELIDIATGENNSVSKACKYLAVVGLCAKEYVHRNFDETLSGGERKRIELAIALAQNGECGVFDEPEAGVDIWSFEKLAEVLNNGKTNIIVSHQEKILKVADEIIVLNKGKIQKSGKIKNITGLLNGEKCAVLKEGNNAR